MYENENRDNRENMEAKGTQESNVNWTTPAGQGGNQETGWQFCTEQQQPARQCTLQGAADIPGLRTSEPERTGTACKQKKKRRSGKKSSRHYRSSRTLWNSIRRCHDRCQLYRHKTDRNLQCSHPGCRGSDTGSVSTGCPGCECTKFRQPDHDPCINSYRCISHCRGSHALYCCH